MEVTTWQSWANVIDAVKTELGADSMKLEVTDQQILKKLYDHVLPEFSTHSGLHVFYVMTEGHIISEEPVMTYKITNLDHRIVGIKGIIPKSNYIDMQMFQMQHMSGDISDYLVRQNYLDMSNMVRADNSYRFMAPDIIQVTRAGMSYVTNEFVVELDCIHSNPTTIDSTLYREFLDLSIAYCLNWIGKMRKKYNNVTTPYGQIEMNADDMINEARELRQRTLENLLKTPNDQLVWIM